MTKAIGRAKKRMMFCAGGWFGEMGNAMGKQLLGWFGKFVQLPFVVAWVMLTRSTASNHSVYCLLGFGALAALADNAFAELEADEPDCRNGSRFQRILMLGWALFLGLAVSLAEYGIFESCNSWVGQMAYMSVVFVGVTISAWHIAKCLFGRLRTFVWSPHGRRFPVSLVFWLAFSMLVVVYIAYLFSAHYPGALTPDSCYQLGQALGMASFDNHHPILHTLLMAALVRLGRLLFGGTEGGIAFFSVCQIFFLATCYAYMLSSLYRAGVSFLAVVIALLWLAFLPNHLFYSSVLWKNASSLFREKSFIALGAFCA